MRRVFQVEASLITSDRQHCTTKAHLLEDKTIICPQLITRIRTLDFADKPVSEVECIMSILTCLNRVSQPLADEACRYFLAS